MTAELNALARATADYRRLLAVALHDEGMTMERIAELFGVTRQRISRMLREGRPDSR